MNENLALDEMTETSGSVKSEVKAKGDLSHRISYADRIKNAAKEVAEKEAAKRSNGVKPAVSSPSTKKTFGERAEDMGLTVEAEAQGAYTYEDRFGSVMYRTVKTGEGGEIAQSEIPIIAVFTKGADDEEYSYIGPVSEQYKRFKGNAKYIDEIISLLDAADYKVKSESTILSPNNAQIRHIIVLDSPIDIPDVGNVHIQLNITNSYDGTAALGVQAGMWYLDSRDDEVSFVSRGNLGNVVNPAGTDKQKDVVTYVKEIASNLEAIVTDSRDTTITGSDISSVLKKIEKAVGRRRSEILETILSDEDDSIMTSWDMFEAVSKFSTIEETSAAKRWFENLADSFLVVSDEVRKALK